MKSLIDIDTRFQEFFVKTSGIDRDLMLKGYYDEKWWPATELKSVTKEGWIIIVNDVTGLDNLFKTTRSVRK